MEKKITYPFKVNGLNKKGIETWQYVTTIEQAIELRSTALKKCIHSSILQKIDGKWMPIK